MKIILWAFGLRGEDDIDSLRQDIHIPHRMNKDRLDYGFGNLNSDFRPTMKKAIFRFCGQYEDEVPIYEFIDLE